MQITWRNIDAPDFSQAAGILQQGSNNIQGALSNLGGMAQGQVDKDVAANTAQLQEQIRQGVTDQASYNNFDLNQQAEQFGGNVDQQAALDMLLGLRPSFQQQSQFDQTRADQTQQAELNRADQAARDKLNRADKAAQEEAANKSRVAAANITANATASKDQYERLTGLYAEEAAVNKKGADFKLKQQIRVDGLSNIDEGLIGDPKINTLTQLNNKWRDYAKNIENPNIGSYFGGKGGAGSIVDDFNQKLKKEIDKTNAALGVEVSPNFIDFGLSSLDRNGDGAIKLGDLSKVLIENHQRYKTNESNRKLLAKYKEDEQSSIINEDNRVNKNIAKLLGLKGK